MATSQTRKRRTRADGERSYRTIVDTAARLATIEGLEGLSIGRLADEIGMSKSGLYAHFDSKEDLQLAAVSAAEGVFTAEVVAPALEVPEGLERLRTLCEAFVSYVQRGVFPGGCFFLATAAELDTRRGPIRDSVRTVIAGWTDLLETNAREAQRWATWQQTPILGSSPSSSTPCSTKPTAITCSSAIRPRSTEREKRSKTASRGHWAEHPEASPHRGRCDAAFRRR